MYVNDPKMRGLGARLVQAGVLVICHYVRLLVFIFLFIELMLTKDILVVRYFKKIVTQNEKE